MEAGARVRLVGDPGRVGVSTGRQQFRKDRPFVQISFPDRTEWVPEDQLEVIPDSGDSPVDLLRRGRLGRPADLNATLTHIRLSGRLANYIYSLETTDTDFYAYQFKPVVKLLQSVSTGILIADEVGLGKTIEAGLIWTELRSRFDLQRLLVICPAMLRDKWSSELGRRFGVRPEICGASELLRLFREVEAGSRADFVAIASLQGIRPPADWDAPQTSGAPAEIARLLSARAHEEPLVDLLVIDEAHYLRNPETRTAELGALLRRASQYAALLSATPVHLKSDDLFHLLRIVDEDVFFRKDAFDFICQANEHLVEMRDAVLAGTTNQEAFSRSLAGALRHPLLEGNRQLTALAAELERLADGDLRAPRIRADIASRLESANLLGFSVTRTRRRDVKELRAVREARTLACEMNALEAKFYGTVTETVREYCARSGGHEGFLLVMPQRQMSSSMAAALWSWSQDDPQMAEELYEDLGIELPDAEPGTLGPLVSELRQKTSSLGSLTELTRDDTKYTRLREELRTVLAGNPEEKVVLFSSFRHTLRYLAERLRKDGISCGLLLGGQDDKQQTLDEFADPRGPSVLLSSEVGSEGIDLQFAWMLVNYDLPWNPMRVEQRIGRLDRLGQESPKVVIWNLMHANTIDERIYQRLFMRLGIFTRTLGSLETVLGPRIADLTRDLFSKQLTPEQEAARIDQTGVALEAVRKHEETLEAEAPSLVAYGDYILQQVIAAREMARRITTEDIERYVLGFFSQHYPGCRFHQDPKDPAIVDVELSPKAKNDLSNFLRDARSSAATPLTRASSAPVRCRFDNRLRARGRGWEDLITQFHPVVRFVAHSTESQKRVGYPAVAARIRASALSKPLSPGDYRVAIARWNFEALRTTEQLWYGAEPLGPGGHPLDDDDAERLVMAVAEAGEDWPAAGAELDLEGVAHDIEQGLLVRARSRYETHVGQLEAQNRDRADAQLRSLENHLTQQRAKYEELRRRHLARGNPGLAKAQEKNLERLTGRVERQRLLIHERSHLKHRPEELCVGVVRVL